MKLLVSEFSKGHIDKLIWQMLENSFLCSFSRTSLKFQFQIPDSYEMFQEYVNQFKSLKDLWQLFYVFFNLL